MFQFNPFDLSFNSLILGVLLNYVGGYLGSDLVPIFGLAALVVVLMLRPSGLFGATAIRQV